MEEYLARKKSLLKQVRRDRRDKREKFVNNIVIPFRVGIYEDMLANKMLLTDLLNEVTELQYFRKISDLYCFEQSKDFHDIVDLGPAIKCFMEAMYGVMKPCLEDLFDFRCKRISITASRYSQKDYLLCHDDKCGDRYVAFIFYLMPDWEQSDGGLLLLYAHDKDTLEPTEVSTIVVPQWNNFLYFEVGNTTYHEVSEVLAENKDRYTISGWFHSPEAVASKQQNSETLPFNPVEPLLAADSSNEALDFSKHLSSLYRNSNVMIGICEEYEKQNSVLIPNFLEQSFYNQCISELTDDKLEWKLVGPPNQRKYEVATLDVGDPWKTLPKNLADLVRCLTVPNFFDYVESLTGESLSGYEVGVDGRAFSLQLQRWSGGCYSLLSDNNMQTGFNMLDLNLFLKVCEDCSLSSGDHGSIVYTSYSVNVMGQPMNNSIFLVNNEENTGRYVKYINKTHKNCFTYIMYMSCMSLNIPKHVLHSSSSEEEEELQINSHEQSVPKKRKMSAKMCAKKSKTSVAHESISRNRFVVSKQQNADKKRHTTEKDLVNRKISSSGTFRVTDVPGKQQ